MIDNDLIFNHIKNNEWDKANKIIKDNIDSINFNNPYNNIYLIELIIINNQFKILDFIFKNNKNIYLNIYDNDNNPIVLYQ